MLLLGLGTAAPAVTVALHDGMRVLAEAATVDSRRHAELLAPAIAAVQRDAGADRADLAGNTAGTGPGPYTGLRVGVVTARVPGAAPKRVTETAAPQAAQAQAQAGRSRGARP